jgi:sugar/nucleoside kinase (ribokinase family)
MQEVGVDTGGVKWTDPKSDRVYSTRGPSGRLEKVRERELGSGMSFVCLPPWTGDPLIFYSGGSNNVFGREHVDLDYISRAHLLVVDYSTLLPRLDENGGKPMAAVIRDVRARGVLTLLDTHSIPGADYSVLREPLRETDIFACNIHEARGVTGLGPDASMEEVLTSIANRMGVDGKRSRMIAITNKDKPAYLAYCPKGSRKLVIAKVDACKVKVVDGTGAGDGFKAGLAAYVVRNKAAFEAGTLSLTEAGRFANAVAASYISAKGTENVGDYLASAAAARRIYAGARVEETVVEATPRGRRLRV